MKAIMLDYMKAHINKYEALIQDPSLTQRLILRLGDQYTNFCMMHPPIFLQNQNDRSLTLVAREYSYVRLIHTYQADQDYPAIIVGPDEVEGVLRIEKEELEMINATKKKNSPRRAPREKSIEKQA